MLPLPRFVKKLFHFIIHLHFPKVINIRLGVLFVFFMATMMFLSFYEFYKIQTATHAVFGMSQILTIEAKSARNMRNFLIYSFGFLVSLMNFTIAAKQKTIYHLEDEATRLKKAK